MRSMGLQALVLLLQERLLALMAVYAFGSRVREQGRHARADSDLDLRDATPDPDGGRTSVGQG